MHETRVASIIAEKLQDVDYCLVFFQIFTDADFNTNSWVLKSAAEKAAALRVTAVNMSYTGGLWQQDEFDGLVAIDKADILMFIAAGNKTHDLDKACSFYPTCYDLKHIIIVGAQDIDNPKKHSSFSNYGKRVSIWAPGYYNYDDSEQGRSATSYAAPRALADYILFLEHKRLQGVHKAK